ncbi:hypothetical protein LCGC14_0376660 [marine sediment metagenome]|uniref:Uncharacterized protein n=1 Tax=marine sediment metagenome TaxID=412755 RepID=A0A0F9T3H1_9ZZZZ
MEKSKPTIAELEEILNDPKARPITIQPDGSIAVDQQEKEQCSNCRFKKEDLCKRHAPQPLKDTDHRIPKWPDVRDTDWCGEWGKK